MPAPSPHPAPGVAAVATGLTYLAGVIAAGSTILVWVFLLILQMKTNQVLRSYGYDNPSRVLDGDAVDLAVSSVLLLGISALCFIGAARFSAMGRSGLAYAGLICVLLCLIIGTVGSGGDAWSLLMAPVPVGALIALLAVRVATTRGR